MNPKFTVIIPTFNAAGTITAALESVLMQSFTGFEVWVIDGGSSDGTVNVLTAYAGKDKRVQWLSETDNGIYDAMNKGIGKACGEWVYFLGSDDTLHDKQVFETIVKTAEANPQAEMIYGNVLLSAPIGFNHDSLVFAGEFHSNRLLTANICHQAIFYRRDLLKKFGGFNTKYRLLADWDFNLRCFNRISPVYIENIVANFTAGATSAQNRDEPFFDDMLPNLVFRYPYHMSHPSFKKRKRGLTTLLFTELFSLHLLKAAKVGWVLLHQLKPAF